MSSDSADEDKLGNRRIPPQAHRRLRTSGETVGALRIETTVREPGRVSWQLLGDLDAATAPTLARALADLIDLGPPLTITLNLAGIEFCSAAGLTVLLAAQRAAAATGRPLHLECPSRPVQRVVHAAGLGWHLNLVPRDPRHEDHPEAP